MCARAYVCVCAPTPPCRVLVTSVAVFVQCVSELTVPSHVCVVVSCGSFNSVHLNLKYYTLIVTQITTVPRHLLITECVCVCVCT